ncbi:MAG TPA: hypothetical protein VHH73_10010 [Verrucomicrobiae bacterium]|nr:hypothetical protein [Verrucomicrobiae bacterium]
MSANHTPYFQFPLCVLAYGQTVDERLAALCDYAVVETGRTFWEKLAPEQMKELRLSAQDTHKKIRGFTVNRTTDLQVLVGLRTLQVWITHLQSTLNRHAQLEAFIVEYQRKHGRDAHVRIRADLFWDVKDKRGLTEREFCVLCAIYSVIGDKKGPVRITQATIAYRALGYKSKAAMDAELLNRTDGAVLLTDWKLRATIEKLEARKLVCRVTYGRRQTYYSHRLTPGEMRNQIVAAKTGSADYTWGQRRLDDLMTDEIRKMRKGKLARPIPAKAPNGPALAQATPCVRPAPGAIHTGSQIEPRPWRPQSQR